MAAAASYEFPRLGFKRAVIEHIGTNQRFRVITPHGTFEMTRRDFERVFANVVRSQSYRLKGLYHYRLNATSWRRQPS